MPKIKDYSAEAIIGRQQQEYNLWKEKQSQQQQPQPEKDKQQSQQSQNPNQGGAAGQYNLTPNQQPYIGNKDSSIPSAPPFMAQENANIKTILGTKGEEPVYYSGKVRDGWSGTWDAIVANPFKNWARRTYANINNPIDILPSPTAEQTAAIEKRAAELKSKTEANWDYKINKFVNENIFGIDMDEIFQTSAAQEIAKETGKTNVDLNIAVKSLKEAGKTAAFAVLGAPEWIVRNGAAVLKGLDETADEVAGPDKENVQPLIDGAEKLKKAQAEQQFYVGDMPLRNKTGEGVSPADVAKFTKVINTFSPVEIFKDAGRLIMNLDKLKTGQMQQNVNAELAGSSAIYSMIYDDALHNEYVRRFEDGESAQKLALELQNPIVELAGGILLDPTTWITGKSAAKVFVDEKGLRIAQNGLGSAVVNSIDNVLLDTRMPQSIKQAADAIVNIAEGTTPKTRQEALDVIHSTYKAVGAEFEKWKNARGLTTLTSSGKQSLVIEQTTDFFRDMAARAADHPDGMDLFTGTVDAMIKLAKGEGDTAKAFTTLINSPLGQTPLSPRGMRVANMLAGIDEISPAIKKAMEAGDVKMLANMYADQFEKVIKKSILSVEDMRGAIDDIEKITKQIAEAAGDEKKIASLTEKLNEAKKLADDYKKLPAHVRFFNGANELGKKTWLKPMGAFSQLYFGFNRFAYPIRNVLSTIPGMAYEFGLTNALEMATKAISGSQVESLGVSTLKNMSGEIEKLVGYVPEAFKRGDTAIGEFVAKDKRYFGVFRGGGEVSQLGEQLMGAQIMLKTAQRELKNAMKSGVIPDTKILQEAGLHADDAKKIMQYALEFGGDENKVVDAFRKFMGGSEETFRHLPMSEKMEGFLDSIGNGANSLKKELAELQKTAQSADAFRSGAESIWKKVEAMGEIARTEPTQLSDDIPSDFVDDIKKAQMFKYATPETIDNFERVLQGWRNAKAAMSETSRKLEAWFYKNGVDAQKYTTDLIAVSKEAYPRQDAVRTLVRNVYENKSLTSQQMYDALNSMEDFKISKMTEVDPTKVTTQEMTKIMWDAYFRWSGEYWAKAADNYNRGMVDILSRMASDIGTDLPKAARMADVPYQKAVDTFNAALEYYKESKIDSIIAARRKVKSGTTLLDVDMDALKAAGFRSKDHLFNTINKYRTANGLKPWNTHAQVDFWEVEDAVKRLKGSQGLIPDMASLTGKAEKSAQALDTAAKTATSAADTAAPAVSSVPIEQVVKVPRSQLPDHVSNRFEDMAKLLKSQLSGGEAGKRTAAGSFGSTNVQWYKEIYAKLKIQKPAIDAALEKIVKDHGADKGVNVERIKDMMLDMFRYGDAASGTPPDLYVLQQLGFDDKVMQEALDDFNTITKSNFTMEEALSKSMPDAEMLVDKTRPYFNDAGELVEPNLITTKYIPKKMPPIAPDKAVTPSRMIYESMDKARNDFDGFINGVASRWGETSAPVGALNDNVEAALGGWVGELTKRVNIAKTEAAAAAGAARDAMLYDYRKQLWNVAAQYVSPFHYFSVSSVNQWMQNVAADPKWAAIYLDYKQYMADRHAGLPDFWKQNISISNLPGYDKQNPLFFNIEASVNPLYAMIGQDFNDPNRRKDWLSSTVDDLGKVIPGIYQPLQWVVAANLYAKNETEAARRWAGRLIPQTKIIKSVTNALGIDIPLTKYNELDPFVSILNDGLDPFEEGRVLRYLATMPGLTEEQRIEVAHSRTGEVWDAAVRGSLSARAPVEAASFFLGVGFKARTQNDILTDKFYDDYRKLISARSIMPETEYRDAWDALKVKYPFMDTLLIGKRAGDDRDTAFAYNVMGRIPPGEMSDIAKFVGVEPYMLESFYANKGDMSKMTPQDRARFMAAITDLSAMLKMPDGATKQEWTEAKRTYSAMQTEMKKQYGENVLDQISQFYNLPESQRDSYLQTFPQVEQAMQAQTAYVANTPILAAYYGGIDAVAKYYNNGMYIQLEKEFGKDIQDKVDYYYFLQNNGDTKAANAYKKDMGLKEYFARQQALQQEANIAAVNTASQIPEGKDYAIRPEFQAQSGIQENALTYASTDQQSQAAQQIWESLSAPMKTLVEGYYNGEELPYAVSKRLEYLGEEYGLSKQEVLRLLGVEVAK